MNWINLNDKIPKCGEKILLCDSRGNMSTGYFIINTGSIAGFKFDGTYMTTRTWALYDIVITHWMPLPAPPSND